MRSWAASIAVACAGLVGLANAALAAEELAFGPRPDWVEPGDLPLDAPSSGALATVLLQNQQIRFGEPADDFYSESAVRIDTPEGLGGIGSVAVSWRPDTDTPTIHELSILRDGQTIDLLAAGQEFAILRRENNLEYAMLDGMLTAALQPEGLRVGDTLRFAFSLSSADPVLAGSDQYILPFLGISPVSRLSIRALWPADTPMRWSASEALDGDVQEEQEGGLTEVRLDLEDVEPTEFPELAPTRFQLGRRLEFTDFASWTEVAELMAPYYADAARLEADSPLHAEVERIRAAHEAPEDQAMAALRLVQDDIRYLFIGMNEGGLVPATADETWSRRFGDCKAKTVLLMALLRELGIEAAPAAVSSVLGDGLDERLPMVAQFDHVVVRVSIGGEDYYLDGTQTGDRMLERQTGAMFRWALPLVEGGDLVRTNMTPPDLPDILLTTTIDATGGLDEPAPFHGELSYTGDLGTFLRVQLAGVSSSDRETALRLIWDGLLIDFEEIDSVSADYVDATGDYVITLDGSVDLDVGTAGFRLIWDALDYNPGLSVEDEDREAPLAVEFPFHSLETHTVLLPDDGEGFGIMGEDLDLLVGSQRYIRTAEVSDGVATSSTRVLTLGPEVPVDELEEAREIKGDIFDTELGVTVPVEYANATSEQAAGRRAAELMDEQKFEEAVAELADLPEDEEEVAPQLALRAVANIYLQDLEAARADLDAAARLDPDLQQVLMARGLLAEADQDWRAAVQYYSRVLRQSPKDFAALRSRAYAHRALGNTDEALEDSLAATELQPEVVELYQLRANIHGGAGDTEEALAEADALIEASPDDATALAMAGAIYASFGRDEEADAAFARSIEVEPNTFAYLTRAANRPKDDIEGRRADIEAAMEVDPQMTDAARLLAELEREAGRYEAAIAALDVALEAEPDNMNLLNARGVAYSVSGAADMAEADFVAAREAADGSWALNALCWDKATSGVALEAALADCDAALSEEPANASYLDSRGLVLLRMGRLEEALVEYSLALRIEPSSAHSLFGRGLVKQGLGDAEGAEADMAAAAEQSARIAEEFAEYGLTPEPADP